jgi:Na+/melibiose symporter-like transporter
MLAMVSLGVGEVVGAIGMGIVVDIIGSKRACILNIFFIAIAASSIVLFLFLNEYSWLAYLMTFLWGVQDSCISIHLDAILGFEFDTNKEPFSCDILVESITCFGFEILQSFMKTREMRIIYMAVVGGIGVTSAFIAYFFNYRERHEEPKVH